MFPFVFASLKYYWRTHLAVLLGVFLASTVLTGALLVGDCVRASLRRVVEEKQGAVETALVGNDRFFSQLLAQKIEGATGAPAVPLLQVMGSVANETGSVRVNNVNVSGVPDSFWSLGQSATAIHILDGSTALNNALADRLRVRPGDTVVARLELPGTLSRDAPLSGESDETVTLRLDVQQTVGAEAFGNYSLQVEQSTALNLFVPLGRLQDALEKPERANVILFPQAQDTSGAKVSLATINEAWTADDADLGLAHRGEAWDLVSRRVLLDWEAEKQGRRLEPSARGVFTYLIDSIETAEGNATPYSMVSAVEPAENEDALFPPGFGDDDILINAWLADDLGAAAGDQLTLTYRVFLPGRRLEEKRAQFTVAGILPMDHPAVNPNWTPEFPGISDAANCRDWEPGIPIDYDRIGDEDEQYWDDYKGTPKAFITLRRGQALWSNRFGQLTSLRFGDGFDEEAFRARLDGALTPAAFGVQWLNIAAGREDAVANSLEFGMYLSMFSGFLIIAAIVLTILLFALGIDQRMTQFGLLRSVGFPSGSVRRLQLLEGGIIAAAGAGLGVLGGLAYTKLMIGALSTIWKGAVGSLTIVFDPSVRSILSGSYVVFFIAVVAMFFATQTISKRTPVSLLGGAARDDATLRPGTARRLISLASFWIGAVCLGLGLISVLGGLGAERADVQAIIFATAGFLLLTSGIAFVNLFLRLSGRVLHACHQLGALGIRNSARKRGRSLGVIIVMAAGVFIICVTNAFHLDATQDGLRRDSGTGGFPLLGESTLPIYGDLNATETRELHGLEDIGTFSVVSFRVREGEEASCLNLTRAQQPRIMAVDPSALADRGAFSFHQKIGEVSGSPWQLLNGELDGAIPGFLDLNSAMYALKVSLGDEIEYVDEFGNPLKVRIVALLKNSIFQGNLLISESNYLEHFFSAGGYRFFLFDVDLRAHPDFPADLTRMLEPQGLSLVSTADRLNEFNTVQNTYLQMMSTLGGLGLLLGTLGLAVVTFRNILERRQELALMEAVGFSKERVSWLVVSEHWFLHLSAVILGVGSALLAVLPALVNSGQKLPFLILGTIILAIFAGGLCFCYVAARSILRRPLLESLRTE